MKKMNDGENIFTADARELEYSRPARRRGITKLMRAPPRGAVRSVRRRPLGEEMPRRGCGGVKGSGAGDASDRISGGKT